MQKFVIIIGHDVSSKKPYATNKLHPIPLIILNLIISLFKKETNTTTEAAYPTTSVRVMPNKLKLILQR